MTNLATSIIRLLQVPFWKSKRSADHYAVRNPLQGVTEKTKRTINCSLRNLKCSLQSQSHRNIGQNFCAPTFSYILRSKKGALLCRIVFLQAFRPSRLASKPALTSFVLVLRHWSSRLALRPASNFVSSYNFCALLQFL